MDDATIKKLVDGIRDALADLSQDEFTGVFLNVLENASDKTIYDMMFMEGIYEVGAICGDADEYYSYDWLDESIDDAYSFNAAIKIAQNAINSGDWPGYTIVILRTPDSMLISDRSSASNFEIWRQYVPEEEE